MRTRRAKIQEKAEPQRGKVMSLSPCRVSADSGLLLRDIDQQSSGSLAGLER